MKEWPILFRAPLVRANRDGRKNVTRRLSPKWAAAKPGDRIVVRETWRADVAWDRSKPSEITPGAWIWYEAGSDGSKSPGAGKLRPSIFLPRWASRDVYTIVSVREERLQDITEDEARREGVIPDADCIANRCARPHRDRFLDLWDEINGKKAPWRSNPIVWRVEYENPVSP